MKASGVMRACALFGLAAALPAAQAEVSWWAVPAMSEEQRLPDVIPADGEKGGTVRIVAARGEYEPGSFVVRSDADLGKVTFALGALKDERGRAFPADRLDLKVVKVWYQNRNGWFSYFADDGFKLCPELLLNDEDLIRVDTEKVANYARLVEKDGTRHERWLNPPYKMNWRYFDHYREADAFPCMTESFRDAKTLQPVSLERNVSKQFILTAHVTEGVPAGIYRGSVRLTARGGAAVGEIPVALRVLDFTLPQPMAYGNPERRMLIASYHYLGLDNIRVLNGDDSELAWRQLEAILRNQVAHGQDMHWVDGRTGSADTERTIRTMKAAGMRTDVLLGGVSFQWMCTNRTMMTAWATRMADYYDRTLGHHNVYGSYGDEPGCGWMVNSRPVFDAYHDAGLKFVIASQRGILWKCGYNWDWHNSSDDAIDSGMPNKWNEMGDDTYCAWYANMHVGPENPAYNRRQYGLGAWLAGYTAFCNYAHHLGPYNDVGETYKPMVFAYGCHDGVLDTLQWEGFREGIDDIRYATLLKALAREADRSTDVDLRALGRKALLYFAAFPRERGDLNVARGEMIARILDLRAALGAKANVTIAAKKAPVMARKPLPALADPLPPKTAKDLQEAKKVAARWVDRNDLEAAIAVYRSLLVPQAGQSVTNGVNLAIGGLYETFFEFGKARAWYLEKGLRLAAAGVGGARDERRRQEDIRLAAAVMADEREQPGERCRAFMRLYLDGCPEAAAGRATFARLRGAQRAADELLGCLTGNRMMSFFGDWKKINGLLDWVEELDGASTNRVWSFKNAQYAAAARLAVGDRKGAALSLSRGLRDAERSKMKPEERYQLQVMKETLLGATDEKTVRRAAAKADAAYGKGLAPDVRKARLERIGSFAMCANLEGVVRALAAQVDSLIRPQPTLTYPIRYSAAAVQGIGGWDRLPVKPQVAKMERPFGGSMDFLETDVSTGDRGEVVKDNARQYARAPEWQAVFDDWGLHFRVEIFDEKAREIEAGALGAGSLEGYLAPGANTPYACFLHDLKPGGFSVWNTAYDHAGHRRISERDRVSCREEMAYTDGSLVIYWGFSWSKFATCVPADGALWDFEPCLWGRKANATWNGLRTVHGRSSWGQIRFEMPTAARASILRKRLLAAAADFRKETYSRGLHEGVIDHWRDAEVGDPAFYATALKPFETRLEEAVKAVSAGMPDAEVFRLEKAALLDDLVDFRFRVEALRGAYLLERLAR